jgi:hypothetical protein
MIKECWTKKCWWSRSKENDLWIIFGRKIDNNKNNEKWKKPASDFLNSRTVNRIYSSIGLKFIVYIDLS